MKAHQSLRLLILALLAGLLSASIQAQEPIPLYSNIPDPLPSVGGRWIFPHEGDPIQAQPFITGETGVISAVRLPLIRHGTPGGVVHVEIWSESNNIPESKVATVGDIDLNTLAPAPGEVAEFTNLQLQLEPETKYFLATNNADAVIEDGFPNTAGATYCFLTDTSDEGSNGAGKLLVLAGSWTPLEVFINSAKYQNMEILELAVESYILTIPTSDRGTVTTSPEGPYPAGTEVTLTATPNDGYVFSNWIIGGEESTENPLTFTIEGDTTITPNFDCVLFNTDVYDPFEIRPGFEMWAVDEVITQPFYTGDSDSIVSVELDVRILEGSPTGRMIIEVWDDDGNGKPSEKVGTFGSVLVDDLPAGSERPVVHTTVEGLVSGLNPQSHYHVIMNHSEVVFHPPLERDKLWYSTYHSDPISSGAGRAAARGDFTGNQWRTLESILNGAADRRFLVMKIIGAKPEPTPIIPEIVEIAYDRVASSVTLTWSSQPAAIYEVEVSADLLGWEIMATQPGTGEQTTVVLHASPNGEHKRFYRLRVRP